MQVGIIGGGAVGLTAALELARRDAEVTLFEADQLGGGATGRAAGICYDAYAQRRDGRIAAASLEEFRERDLLTECPYVWFAREDDEVGAAVERQAKRMAEYGREVRVVGPSTLAERFPALATDDVTTAAIASDAGYVDPAAYVDSLAERATSDGVTIREGTPATVAADGAVRAGGNRFDFDAVLVAAGPATTEVLTDTDVALALGVYRTQVLTAGPIEESLPMYYDASAELYARPTADGVLAGDGSHLYEGDPNSYNRTADEQFVTERLAGLGRRLDTDLSVRDSWAGLCTATPDRDPLVGSAAPGLYVATGFCGHGFMRSPAIGTAIAAEILGEPGISAYDPTRFTGNEPISLPTGVTE